MEKLKLKLKYKHFIIFVIAMVVIAGLFLLIYGAKGLFNKDTEEVVEEGVEEIVEEESDLIARKIDGVMVEKEKENPLLFAVMNKYLLKTNLR